MTVAEAVGLVLLAGLGGYGELCILDMGEPIRIADLAEHMITMAGLVPGIDIPIVFTGLRPGEKLEEALFTDEEERTQEVRNKIYIAKSPPPPVDFQERLELLCRAAANGDRDSLALGLRRIVPTYCAPVLELVPDIDSGEAVASVTPLRPKAASAS
jgi:FlaA1/EpsC-like NDP-sugar epimerase